MPTQKAVASTTLGQLKQAFDQLRRPDAPLNMTRGLPSPAQVALAEGFLHLPGATPFTPSDGTDWLNYGGLEGLKDVRDLFGPSLLGLPGEQVVVGENSSLALMHEAIGHAWVRGFPGAEPWGKAQKVRFLCPEPGYDRHFAICEYYGIEMVPIALGDSGPDMDEVERLVKQDPTLRGIWCVPKHANPNGAVYSATTVDRLAAMHTAAADFKIIWDNAYAVHDFTPGQPSAPDITALCARAGHADRPLLFASTSKMLIPSAGLAFFGGSPAMVSWWLGCRKYKTIGPDKVNQVRHLLFFKDSATLQAHMGQHGDLLRDKFAAVDRILHNHLAGLDHVSWSTPTGGYFVALTVPAGMAKRVVALAEQANVKMTPAGATHCYGVDVHERCLRIAPSYLSLEEVEAATEVIALAVLLAMGQAEARMDVTP